MDNMSQAGMPEGGNGFPTGNVAPNQQMGDDVVFLGLLFHAASPCLRDEVMRFSIQSLISLSTQADARVPSFTGAGNSPRCTMQWACERQMPTRAWTSFQRSRRGWWVGSCLVMFRLLWALLVTGSSKSNFFRERWNVPRKFLESSQAGFN